MAIDHEQRRADIAAITIDLVAREGMEAATIRRIAAEAGFSTTAITHYFADKQDLLVWTFQRLSEEGERRFEEAMAQDPSDLVGALMTMVPWCPANVRRWKAYIAFWDKAARDPEWARLLTRATVAGTASLAALLRPRFDRAADAEAAGELLDAILQGFALQMLVSPSAWNESRVRSSLSLALACAARS
jgi:TetR/AcrR family transcriptional regulator, transcriptional repressor of bet genes